MLYCISTFLVAFCWMLWETDFLTVRLPANQIKYMQTNIKGKLLALYTSVADDIVVFWKDCGEHALLASSGLGLVLVFSGIAVTGRFWFEDVNWILYGELSLSISFVVFGIVRIIQKINKWKGSYYPDKMKNLIHGELKNDSS